MRDIARMFVTMLTADHLLSVVDAYREAHKVSDARVSTLVFNDGKRVRLLREGGDVGSRSLAGAFRWFSDHWPSDATWPADVPRPPRSLEPANTAAPETTGAAA